jgi:hypothetical protein
VTLPTCTHLDLVIIAVLIHIVNGLLDIAQHQVAMAVIGLSSVRNPARRKNGNPDGKGAYVKLALELSVTPQLDKDHLVEQQAHQVEGLGHVVGLFDVGHGECGVEQRQEGRGAWDASKWYCLSVSLSMSLSA